MAVEEAKLGSLEEILECVKMADILKPAKAAAQDMLQHMTPATDRYSERGVCQHLIVGGGGGDFVNPFLGPPPPPPLLPCFRKSLSELAPALVELCGSKLVAVTDGAAGSIIATADNVGSSWL